MEEEKQSVLILLHYKIVSDRLTTILIGLYHSNLAPDDSPVNVRVSVINSSSLQIQWEPPLIPNGIITHYTLYINYTNGSEISTKTVGSQLILYLLEDLKPHQQVGISMSATTSGGEGPHSDYVYNTTEETG